MHFIFATAKSMWLPTCKDEEKKTLGTKQAHFENFFKKWIKLIPESDWLYNDRYERLARIKLHSCFAVMNCKIILKITSDLDILALHTFRYSFMQS